MKMNDMTPHINSFQTLPETAIKIPEQPKVPTWKPRWWYDLRKLDARPVIWSLKNRPQDWRYDRYPRPITIIHTPSNHEFWITMGSSYLYRTDGCGCQRSKEQKFQKGQHFRLRWALRQWNRHYHQKLNEPSKQKKIDQHKHFQEHFTLGRP